MFQRIVNKAKSWGIKSKPFVQFWLFWTFIVYSLILFASDFLNMLTDAETQISALLIVGILALLITLLFAFQGFPSRYASFTKKYYPLAILLGIVIPIGVVVLNWTSVLLECLINLEVDYPNALAISIGIIVISSFAVLAKGLHTHINLDLFYCLQLDNHRVLIQKADICSSEILHRFRQREIQSDDPEMIAQYDTLKATTELEMAGSTILALLALSIYFRVFAVAGYWFVRQSETIVLGMALLMIWAICATFDVLRRYRTWRNLWKSYWTFVRNVTLPDDAMLDVLPPITTSVRARILSGSDEGRKAYLLYAMDLAEKYDLEFNNHDDWLNIEYLNWYDRVHTELEMLDKRILAEFDAIREFEVEFDKLGGEFPRKQFVKLVKSSQVLILCKTALLMPDVFEGVTGLLSWNTTKDQKLDVFNFSTNQLDYFRSLPAVPIPSSVTWLIALFLFSLSIIPYALTIGLAVLSP